MRYVVNNEQSIIDIADAIREKLEIQDPISIPDMPDYIESIGGGGVYEVNINGNNCSFHNMDDTGKYGDFKENGDQGFDGVLEAYASGYQVIVHLTYANQTYDCVVSDIFDFDTGSDFYYPDGGITRFSSGTGFMALCRKLDSSYDVYEIFVMTFFCNASVVSSYHDS